MLAVGSENGERADAGPDGWIHRHERSIEIAEAALLSIVTLTAAWSGYLAAKWHTKSSLELAKASATRTAHRDRPAVDEGNQGSGATVTAQ